MYILGISAFYHDSAACLIENDKVIAAAQEERFSRKKHDQNFPSQAILFCLESTNLDPDDIDSVVFYEKPFLKFERILETFLSFAPKGLRSFVKAMPVWVTQKLFQKRLLLAEIKRTLGDKINWESKLLFSDHHLSHAASAFYPSPYKSAIILTLDGVGEWATTSLSIGENNKLEVLKEINFPHSLGLLYSTFTYYLGFKVNSGEYKVMGLAPYGCPKYVELIKNNLISIYEDGSFQLDMSYFGFCTDMVMTNEKFHKLFGSVPRTPESEITQFHKDLAASIQVVLEKVIILIAKNARKISNTNNLCLAGGVALNCSANGKLLKSKIFDNIWIQPASGDSGGALGAALAAYHLHFKKPRRVGYQTDGMAGTFLGPSFESSQILTILDKYQAVYEEKEETELMSIIAEEIALGKIIGLFQGKMEFGPRALGNRSILADARIKDMQSQLNLKIKFRESFRPFAPSILEEQASDWFELPCRSPYMLFVTKVKKNKLASNVKDLNENSGNFKELVSDSLIPAVTHVDCSARVQTVNKKTNLKFYKLLKQFYDLTGCPVLINTSFNVRGEPIVCSPEDAFKCFMNTHIDILVIENFILYKDMQKKNYLGDAGDKSV